ncbi:CRISPR-associated endoribonuclease Cas6 [Candidatus Micrarchaeota archaeon]|nr:CRISPR-associated endoribonuclease Cas6 [Candidatus Micrarchaeota archaeon]
MRIKLSLKPKDAFIPFNYSQYLHAAILDKLRFSDPEYAAEVHDSRSFKFFNFSEVFIPKGRADKEKGGFWVYSDSVRFFVSSPRERFVRALLSGILASPELRIGPSLFSLESAEVIPPPDFSSGRAVFKTISPIVASTLREKDGKTRTWDLTPHDTQFYSNINKNLARKYGEFHGKELPSWVEIKVLEPLRTRRIQVKNEFHVGNMMVFEARGSRELLDFAYECGFGERNSMGFGMVDVRRGA